MRLLLSCDDYIYFKNGIYYVRDFGYILIFRYLSVFDSISLFWRTKKLRDHEDLGMFNVPITDSRISVVPIPFFQGPIQYAKKRREIKAAIEKSVITCDRAIFRMPSTIGFQVLKYVKSNNIPYALELVANPFELAKNEKNVIIKLLMLMWHRDLRNACKLAKGIAYVTKRSLQNVYPIKTGQFTASYSSADISDLYFSGERKKNVNNPVVICHVAHPIKSHSKGHALVIEVIARLKELGYNVCVKFAGEGSLIPYFKDLARQKGVAEQIDFVGLLNKRELADFLRASDIMLFPSLSEGLPRVLIEAMATGLPCIASDVGGIPELLRPQDVFKYNDLDGFVSRVAALLNSPDEYIASSSYSVSSSLDYKIELLQKTRTEFYNSLKI